jgi:hypothetical protein
MYGLDLFFASVTCLQGYIRWDPFVLGAQPLDMHPLSLCWHNKTLLPANCLKSPVSQLANPATFSLLFKPLLLYNWATAWPPKWLLLSSFLPFPHVNQQPESPLKYVNLSMLIFCLTSSNNFLSHVELNQTSLLSLTKLHTGWLELTCTAHLPLSSSPAVLGPFLCSWNTPASLLPRDFHLGWLLPLIWMSSFNFLNSDIGLSDCSFLREAFSNYLVKEATYHSIFNL